MLLVLSIAKYFTIIAHYLKTFIYLFRHVSIKAIHTLRAIHLAPAPVAHARILATIENSK